VRYSIKAEVPTVDVSRTFPTWNSTSRCHRLRWPNFSSFSSIEILRGWITSGNYPAFLNIHHLPSMRKWHCWTTRRRC